MIIAGSCSTGNSRGTTEARKMFHSITRTAFAARTAVATISAVAAATTTGTRRAFFARLGDVDRQGAALEFLAVKHLDRLVGLVGGREIDEGETARFAGELVEHDVHRGDHTGLREILLQVGIDGGEREVANEQPGWVRGRIGLPQKKLSEANLPPAGSLNVPGFAPDNLSTDSSTGVSFTGQPDASKASERVN